MKCMLGMLKYGCERWSCDLSKGKNGLFLIKCEEGIGFWRKIISTTLSSNGDHIFTLGHVLEK